MIDNAPTFLDESRDPEQLSFDPEWVRGFAKPTLLTLGGESPPLFASVVAKLAKALPDVEETNRGYALMPTDRRIDYIEFPAENLQEVKEFYSAVFGWSFEDYGPDYCAFKDGRLDGGFYRADARSSVSSGSPLVIIYADDLEETERRVREHSGTIVKEIFSFPAGRRFHFADPNGNELAVWSES